jgi:hypothetical protein
MKAILYNSLRANGQAVLKLSTNFATQFIIVFTAYYWTMDTAKILISLTIILILTPSNFD